jgi:hypothetical protein
MCSSTPFNLGAGWRRVVNVTPRRFTPRERKLVPITQKAEWAPGPVWMAAENPAPNGIRSPDRAAHSESLYPLRYLNVSVFFKVTVDKRRHLRFNRQFVSSFFLLRKAYVLQKRLFYWFYLACSINSWNRSCLRIYQQLGLTVRVFRTTDITRDHHYTAY